LRQEGKPEAMLDIAKGKLARFFKDTLVNQFISDSKLSVANYVKSLDKDLIVTGFKRAALDNPKPTYYI
jgi:elongation factor Ts